MASFSIKEAMEGCKKLRNELEFPSSTIIDLKESFELEFRNSPQKGINNHCFPTPPLTNEAVIPTIRASETPRSHRTKPENPLPLDFKTKCIIYCDASPQPISQVSSFKANIKRCLPDHVVTPKKKIKPLVSLSLMADETLQEQKENSPIKIEIKTAANVFYANKALNFCSLTLKQPSFKISSHVFYKTRKSCDILSNLADRGMIHVMQRILNHLDPVDLVRLQSVSKNYKNLLSQVVPREKLGVARIEVLKSKENIGAKPNPIVKWNETTPKKLFRVNQEFPSPKRRAPLSPQLSPSSKRFHYYIQTAKTLERTERLEKCPRCSYPAIRKELVATCSGCNYSFCVQCRSIPHLNKVCNFFIPSPESPNSRKSRRWGIGTKANKKALRRL